MCIRDSALNTVLGGGISSRLYRSLREDQGLAYYIHSEYQAYRDVGLLWIEGVTQPESLLKTIELIQREIQQLANIEIDDEELWRTKMQMQGQQQLAADSTHTRMSRLLSQEFYFGRHLPEAEVLDEIECVTAATIREIAQQLKTATASCAALVPAGISNSTQQIKSLLNQSSELVLT